MWLSMNKTWFYFFCRKMPEFVADRSSYAFLFRCRVSCFHNMIYYFQSSVDRSTKTQNKKIFYSRTKNVQLENFFVSCFGQPVGTRLKVIYHVVRAGNMTHEHGSIWWSFCNKFRHALLRNQISMFYVISITKPLAYWTHQEHVFQVLCMLHVVHLVSGRVDLYFFFEKCHLLCVCIHVPDGLILSQMVRCGSCKRLASTTYMFYVCVLCWFYARKPNDSQMREKIKLFSF